MSERVKKNATRIAVAGSVLAALLSYLEARSVAKAAEAKARTAALETMNVAKKTRAVGNTQGAVYERLAEQIQRNTKDIDACHARVDKVFDGLIKLASRRSRRDVSYLPGAVEQTHILRPPRSSLPKKKSDVEVGDPLAGALK